MFPVLYAKKEKMANYIFLRTRRGDYQSPAVSPGRLSLHYGMIATGNHWDFDSLRGAPRPPVRFPPHPVGAIINRPRSSGLPFGKG